LAAGLWLFLIFTTHYFSHVPGSQPTFQRNSDALVNQKIIAGLPVEQELKQFGGFLHFSLPGMEAEPYLSQAGGQGALIYYIYQLLRPVLDAETYLSLARMITALLLVILLVAAAFHVVGQYSLLAVAISLCIITYFSWITYFSTSLYWQIWGQFLPFVVAFLLYPRVLNKRLRFFSYVTILGVLVMLKALSGYEYITNVVAAASVPVVYYGFRERLPIRTVSLQVMMIGLAGIVGFVVAFGIHLLQGAAYLGSFDKMLDVLTTRASIRTFGERPLVCRQGDVPTILLQYMAYPVLPRVFSPVVFMFAAAVFQIELILFSRLERFRQLIRFFFSKPGKTVFSGILALLFVALSSFIALRHPPLVLLAWLMLAGGNALLVLTAYRVTTERRPDQTTSQLNDVHALACATLYAIPVSLTWNILALGHAACHFHMNHITFFLPFGLMFTYISALFIVRGYALAD
jgi:hypothetical protein